MNELDIAASDIAGWWRDGTAAYRVVFFGKFFRHIESDFMAVVDDFGFLVAVPR